MRDTKGLRRSSQALQATWRLRSARHSPVSCLGKGEESPSDEDPKLSDGDFEALIERVNELRENHARQERATAQNWSTGRRVHKMITSLEDYVRHISLDEDSVACGTCHGTVYIFDIFTGRQLGRYEGLEEEVSSVYLEGNVLVAGGVSGEVWKWDVQSAEGRLVCHHRHSCTGLQMTRKGSLLSVSRGGDLRESIDGDSELRVRMEHPILCLQMSSTGYAICGLADGRIV
ncbi:hypothetical protein CYMTET_21977, partial [Cymbomonas tetramitiformis]